MYETGKGVARNYDEYAVGLELRRNYQRAFLYLDLACDAKNLIDVAPLLRYQWRVQSG